MRTYLDYVKINFHKFVYIYFFTAIFCAVWNFVNSLICAYFHYQSLIHLPNSGWLAFGFLYIFVIPWFIRKGWHYEDNTLNPGAGTEPWKSVLANQMAAPILMLLIFCSIFLGMALWLMVRQCLA